MFFPLVTIKPWCRTCLGGNLCSKVSWQLLFTASCTLSRARPNTPVLPVFVQPGSEEMVFYSGNGFDIQNLLQLVKFYLIFSKKETAFFFFIHEYVKEKVIMTLVKMRERTLFMTILMDVSWAETLGSTPNVVLANGVDCQGSWGRGSLDGKLLCEDIKGETVAKLT